MGAVCGTRTRSISAIVGTVVQGVVVRVIHRYLVPGTDIPYGGTRSVDVDGDEQVPSPLWSYAFAMP